MHQLTIVIGTWASCCSGTLSAIASSIIVYMMISDRENKLQMPNNRFLLVMSLFDIVQSIAYATSSMPLPRDSGAYLASGNKWSCSIQAFFLIMGGSAVPCYNASLSIWYLMVVKYNMRPVHFAAKIEPYCHGVSILLPVLFAVTLFPLDMYGERKLYCWIRVDHPVFSLSLSLAQSTIIGTSFIIVLFCHLSVQYTFWKNERMMRQYSHRHTARMRNASAILLNHNQEQQDGSITNVGNLRGSNRNSNRRFSILNNGTSTSSANSPQSRRSAKQGLLFSFAFFITFVFPAINLVYHRNHGDKLSPYLIPQSIFLPLQGVWNLIIYIRIPLGFVRRDYPELSFLQAIMKMIFHPEEVRPPTSRFRGSIVNIGTTRRVPGIIQQRRSISEHMSVDGSGSHTYRRSSRASLVPMIDLRPESIKDEEEEHHDHDEAEIISVLGAQQEVGGGSISVEDVEEQGEERGEDHIHDDYYNDHNDHNEEEEEQDENINHNEHDDDDNCIDEDQYHNDQRLDQNEEAENTNDQMDDQEFIHRNSNSISYSPTLKSIDQNIHNNRSDTNEESNQDVVPNKTSIEDVICESPRYSSIYSNFSTSICSADIEEQLQNAGQQLIKKDKECDEEFFIGNDSIDVTTILGVTTEQEDSERTTTIDIDITPHSH